MTKRTALALAALLAGCAGCAPKAPVDTTAEDLAAIRALEDRFVAAFDAKDANAIMALYTQSDDMVVFDATPPRQYKGWAAYKKDWQDMFAGSPGPMEMKLTDLEITVGGDVAYSHSIQASALTDKTGKKTPYIVRVTDGYRKVNGVWLISHEHVSVPVDLGTMKPDLESK